MGGNTERKKNNGSKTEKSGGTFVSIREKKPRLSKRLGGEGNQRTDGKQTVARENKMVRRLESKQK